MNMFNESENKFKDFFDYLLPTKSVKHPPSWGGISQSGPDINNKQESLKRAPVLIAAQEIKQHGNLSFLYLKKGAKFNTSDMLKSDIWYYLTYNSYLSREEKKCIRII